MTDVMAKHLLSSFSKIFLLVVCVGMPIGKATASVRCEASLQSKQTKSARFPHLLVRPSVIRL